MSSIAAGSVITLTARVNAGATAVNPGQVKFCDSSATSCADIHLLGTAQLTTAGTATFKLRPGIGSYSYTAVFMGTNKYSSSTSVTMQLTATGTIPSLATSATINQAGSWGAYTLSATVTETGNTAAPSGSVSFLDTNHGNAVLGTGTLGAATRGVAWSAVSSSAPTVAGVSWLVTDLNDDGIPDLFVKDYFGTYDVLLGKGDGTFTVLGSPFGPSSGIGSFVVGDFNNDGIPDVAAVDGQYLALTSSITIFLGNGDGTFTVAGTSPALGYNPTAITTADINGDGNADLVLSEQESESSGNGQVLIFWGNGDGTFTQASSSVSLASVASSILPADLNGDGNVDLVMCGAGPSGTILLGRGDGTFTSVTGPGAAINGSTIAVADLNSDGIPDLVFETSHLTVFLGNGDGTFTEVSAGANDTLTIGGFAVGDFNQDGIPDIVYDIPGTVRIGMLFGQGDGTFIQSTGTANYAYDFSGVLAVADFNGDGWPDVLTEDGNSRTFIDALTQPTETATALATVSIAVAVTHLGDASYPGDSNYNPTVSGTLPLWGAPPATTTALTVTSGGAPVSSVPSGTAVTLTSTVVSGASPIAAGQVNFCDATATSCSDIHLLATVALSSNGTAAFNLVPGPGTHSYKAVFVQNGYGLTSSSAPTLLTVGSAPPVMYSDTTAVSASGSPGDYSLTATVTGYGGSAVPTGTVSFLDTSFGNASLGTAQLGSGVAGLGWLISQTPAFGTVPISEVTADFNGDGIPDVAVLSSNSSSGGPYTIAILQGKGDGTLSAGTSFATGLSASQSAQSMIVGDFNGDAKTDIAILSYDYSFDTSVTIFAGRGDGTFGSGQTSPAYTQPNTGGDFYSGMMAAADFNGDGNLDVAVSGDCINDCGITVLLGNGDGTFKAGMTFAVTQDFGLIATGDFNGDGVTDIVATNYFEFGGSPTIFLGKGDGTFTPKETSFTLDYFPPSLVVGDFNGDGSLDLAFSDLNGVEIALGKGDGTFTETPASPMAVPSEIYSLKAGDFNHDGKLDLAGVDSYNDKIVLLIGAGDGTFAVTATTPAVSTVWLGPFAIAAADFNEDGIPDLAMLTKNQATASILITSPTETASATLGDVAPVGAGTHNVEASYPGDSNYPSAISAPVALDAGLKPVIVTPAGGTFSSIVTVTMTEAIPGATIYYEASGAFTTNGWVQYTAPIVMSIGGQETITAYATETGYSQSNLATAAFNLNFPVAPAPIISPAGGVSPGSQTVTITDPASAATIYYTTDGTSPTTSSAVYLQPITISTSETVAAMAVGGGYSASPSVSAQFFIQSSQSRFIYTIAGSGYRGFAGDGGPAPLAVLNGPSNTAVDSAGNLYIADGGNRVVRKVEVASGTISTVAGTGTAGYSGDGGPATSAQLYYPNSLALDTAGNLYISDSGNGVIRRVDARTGNIATYAGNSTATTIGDGGPAANAKLTYPQGIAFDSAGDLYIGEQTRVRVVNANTGIISTVAGNGTYGFSGDGGAATSAQLTSVAGIAFDQSGNLYLADSSNNVIRKVMAATGIITSVAGQGGPSGRGYSGDGGPATSARLSGPQGVTVDSAGNLYIADTYNYVLREVTAVDGTISTISGHPNSCSSLSGDGGPAVESALCYATGVTVDGHDNLYIAESGISRIRKITLPIVPPSAATAQPSFSVAAGSYVSPQTLTVSDATPGAEIYVTINGTQAIPVGQGYFGPIGITGSASVQAVAVAPGYLPSDAASAVYTITTPPTAIIDTFAGNGTTGFSGVGGPAIDAGLVSPEGLAFDSTGSLYIADPDAAVVWMVSATTGNITVAAGVPGVHSFQSPSGPATSTPLYTPQQVAVDTAGNLYISDQQLQRVLRVDAKTDMMTVYAGSGNPPSIGDGGPATQAWISPAGIAFDQAGNLYIADTANGRIRKVSAATGIISTVAGGGTNGLGDGGPATSAVLSDPGPIVFDSKGNLFVGDLNTARVRVVDAKTGIITTFAGNGNNGGTGDGGQATTAEIIPEGLAIDSADNLYISNTLGGIRMVPAGGGLITRVIGVPFAGFGGDGGAASMAEFCAPDGLAFDKTGSLYIADSCNNRVRKVTYPAPAATPTFSVASGTYAEAQTVTITDATQDAAIYYTTDGSVPTTGSTLYNAPLTVASSETVKAIAVAAGYTVSAVASANYVIGNQKAVPDVGVVKSSLNPSMTGTAVTFSVTISSGLGSPSGTVTFMDGAAQLGSGTLTGGSANYTTSALAAGSHSITAVYSGDVNFTSVTSTALTQVVESFSIALPGGSSSTATASPGGQAKYTFVITPPATGSALTFAVTGLPAGATGTFSPATVAAGAGVTNVTMIVTLPATIAMQSDEQPFGRGALALSFGLVLLPFARRIGRGWRNLPSLLLLIGIGVTFCFGVSACGGSGPKQSPSPQTYTLTVTASSGTLAQSTTVTLIVQ
ncbi:MAG TPA: FG-GAP-like repeat-containing protein [Acidobacteriaceae bacterium]|nr:FG-GAP-like repeat-containing protein [Acidobacteriaceae bacterium]